MPLTYQLDVKKFKLIAETKVIVIYDNITTYARVYVFGLPRSSSYGLPTLETTNDNAGKLVQYYWFWKNCDPSTIEIMFTYNKQESRLNDTITTTSCKLARSAENWSVLISPPACSPSILHAENTIRSPNYISPRPLKGLHVAFSLSVFGLKLYAHSTYICGLPP